MAMCLNCKSCAANCPCGVEADELILRARNAAVKARGLHPVKKNVFRLLANRSLFDAALKLGGMFGWMTFKEIPGKNAVVSRLPMPGMDPERATPPLAAKPLRSQYPEVIACPHPKYRVAFFTGCTINYMYTDIGKAVASGEVLYSISILTSALCIFCISFIGFLKNTLCIALFMMP